MTDALDYYQPPQSDALGLLRLSATARASTRSPSSWKRTLRHAPTRSPSVPGSSSPSISPANAASSTCRSRPKAPTSSSASGSAHHHSLRTDPQLRRDRRATPLQGRPASGGSRQRQEPHRHRRALPPGDRQRRPTHRLRRWHRAKAMAAGPRSRRDSFSTGMKWLAQTASSCRVPSRRTLATKSLKRSPG